MSVVAGIAKGIIGGLVGPLTDLGGKYIDNQTSREKFKADLEQIIAVESTKLAAVQANVIMAEMQGSWLQRSWRPISALCFLWIVVWFGWLQPATVAWWGWTPLRVGDALLLEILSLLKVCLGGYIGGRSAEKIAAVVSEAVQKRRN